MKGLIKRWMKEAMNEMEGGPETASIQIRQATPPRTTAMDVTAHMATSVATIYRIDNGFLVSLNMNGADHTGARGSLVYAKDAAEIAEQVIANEAKFKLGINSGPQAGPTQAYVKQVVPGYLGAAEPDPWSKKLLGEYKGNIKAMKEFV